MTPVLLECAASLAAGLVGGALLGRHRQLAGRHAALPPEPVAPPLEPVPPPADLFDLLDLVPHAVVALDRDGTLQHANKSARQQLGDALDALLRHPVLGEALRALRPGEAACADVAMDVPVRRVLRLDLRADRGLVLLSLSDRTQQETVERVRSDFIAYASHELRTPLASLTGFIDTLLGPAADDPPAQKRFLLIMAAQAARMRRLIDNLLSLSRVQMSEHERPQDVLQLGPLVRRVAEEQGHAIRAAGAALGVEVEDGLPAIRGDADQLTQVVINLLDNALKYGATPGRQPRIQLRAALARAGDESALPGALLSVRDNGPGIDAQHVPRLTERFYRVEERGSGRSGSGLGLAIVKHIVGRHGGRLIIDSTPGTGSCFSVWLPLAAAGTPATAQRQESGLLESGRRL